MRKKTIEDYVEMIYTLQKMKDRVKTSDIASAFNISPASVTEIFQKLAEEGYVDYERYGGVKLRIKGEKIAVDTIKKHNILREFLIALGVREKIANEDACKIEHVINKETMNRLTKFVDFASKSNKESGWIDRFHHSY